MKKNIISISGQLASGKTEVTRILKDELNYKVYSNGQYARELAENLNMSINEFNDYLEMHPEIDIQIENNASQYAKNNDNFIIDARLGWYAVPYSFKVYLTVDIDVSAERAFYDEKRKVTENFSTIEEQKEDIAERYNKENIRYLNLYHIKIDDLSNYDLVIDTTNMTIREVVDKIKTEYSKWQEN